MSPKHTAATHWGCRCRVEDVVELLQCSVQAESPCTDFHAGPTRRDRFIEAELHAEEKHRQGMYCAMMVTLTEVLKLEVWDVDASN